MKTERKISTPSSTTKTELTRLAAKPTLTARHPAARAATKASPKAATVAKATKKDKHMSGPAAAASRDKTAKKTAFQTNKTRKASAAQASRPSREKRIRDDFKMPEHDYALINALKRRALEFNRPTKKNELLRAGLQALCAMDNDRLQMQLLSLGGLGATAPPKTI